MNVALSRRMKARQAHQINRLFLELVQQHAGHRLRGRAPSMESQTASMPRMRAISSPRRVRAIGNHHGDFRIEFAAPRSDSRWPRSSIRGPEIRMPSRFTGTPPAGVRASARSLRRCENRRSPSFSSIASARRSAPERNREDHADAQIERAPVIVLRNIADASQFFETAAESAKLPVSIAAASPFGSMRGVLSVMPPPVMCAAPRSSLRRHQRPKRLQIAAMHGQQRVAHRCAHFRQQRVRPIARHFEEQLARQRVAVGVQAGGGQPEQRIARANARAGRAVRCAPPRPR